MKPAKKAKDKPLSRTVKSTQKSAVKKAKGKPLSRTVKRTQKRTPKSTIKLTPLSKFISQWDKEQGPVPTLYDTATKLDEVVNTLTDIQHLMDSALDDCLSLNNEARSMALMHLAYGMIKGVVDKLDPLTTDLYRINRATLDLK
jgi:vacuolar-type H+-ATPase subunit I/STV1